MVLIYIYLIISDDEHRYHVPTGQLYVFFEKNFCLDLLPIFFFFCLFRAATAVCGSSQDRGQIRAATAGLHHSNAISKLHLQPIPKLMATPDP